MTTEQTTTSQTKTTTAGMTYDEFMNRTAVRDKEVESILNKHGKKYIIDVFYSKINKKYDCPDTLTLETYVPQFEGNGTKLFICRDDNAIKTMCGEVANFLKAKGFPYKVDNRRSCAIDSMSVKCTFTK
jgi:hypothetical protein